VPVTAKLSRKFYDRFGDDLAAELVEWFNSVDATYRADLRELNELNFARFDAKLEQRIVQLDAKLEQRLAQLDAKLEQRIAQLDAKLERSVAELRAELVALEARIGAQFVAFEGKLIGRMEARIAEVRTEMLRWMLAGWFSMMLVLLGTLFAVLKTR